MDNSNLKMKVLVAFLSICGCVLSFPATEDSSGNMVGLINPRFAKLGEIPYQGELHIFTEFGWKGCGASLLTANYALTAAYCVQSAQEMYIVLGNADKQKDQNVTINIKSWVQYGGYNETTKKHDIALVKLATPAHLGGNIGTVKLINKANRNNMLVGVTARLSGWGQDSYWSAQSPNLLEKEDAIVINNNECRKSFNFIDDTQMCTSGKTGGYCTGDQGGPLVVNNLQVGIISGGEKYCEGNLPTFHTRVGPYLEWIGTHSDYKIV